MCRLGKNPPTFLGGVCFKARFLKKPFLPFMAKGVLMHRIQFVTDHVQSKIGATHKRAAAWMTLALMWLMSATFVAAQPTFTQSFSPSSISFLSTSTLVYTIDNSVPTDNITNLSFSDTLTSGIRISGAGSSTCGNASFSPNITVDESSGDVSFSSFGFNNPGFYALAAGATCTVTIPVRGEAVGALTNTSSDLTYQINGAGTNLTVAGASGTLTVQGVAADAPFMTKAYDATTVDQGATVSVTYSMLNTSRTEDLTDLAVTDVLNDTIAGFTFTSLDANTCGGAVSGAGTTTLSLAGGVIAAEATCSITATLTVPSGTSGTFSGTTGAVTATSAGAPITGNQITTSLEVRADAAPTLAMSFSDALSGGTTTGTFTLTNLASNPLTSGSFSMTFSPPLSELSTPTYPANPCGAGSSMFTNSASGVLSATLFSGNIAANDSCVFTVDFPIPADQASGSVAFTTSDPSGAISGTTVTGVGTSATFDIGGGQNASFSKIFSGDTMPGSTVDLTFDIVAAAENSATITDLTFTDDLDAMLSGVTGQSGTASDTCGGTLSGSSTLSYAGGSLAPGASCAITVTLDIPGAATTGTVTNTTSNLTDTAGQSYGTASASLVVSDLTFDLEYTDDPVIAGATANLVFTIQNNSASFDATGLIFNYNLSSIGGGVVATGTPVSACGGSLSGTSFLTFSGGTAVANGSCVISVPVSVPSSIASGTYNTSTSGLIATVNGSSVVAPAAAGALVVETATLLVSEAFASSTLAGQTVVHSYTIENQSGTAASAITLDGNLTTLVTGATFGSIGTDTCGFTAGGVGSTAPALTGGSLAAGASCSVELNYAIAGGTAAGTYPYSATSVTGTVGGLAVTGNASASSLIVTATAEAIFSKSFSPSTINVGGSSTLTYTIDNPVGGATLSDLEFLDDVGGTITGATLSGVPGAGACGAGATVSGTSSISLTGGTLTAGQSCSFTVTVTVDASGAGASYTSTSSVLNENGLAVASAQTAVLNVNDSPPLFSESIAPATIAQGGAALITYTINNAAGSAAIAGISFTDSVPTSALIASTPAATNSCGGTLGATAGGSAISLSGATVGAGASCSVTIPVTSVTVGAASSTSSILTTAVGNSAAVSGALTVTAAPAPTLATVFSPDSIVEGATSVVTYTINNSGALIDATSLSLSNNLPSNIVVLASPAPSTTCTGGTLTAAEGSSAMSYAGGTVAAGASCTISMTVLSAVDGAYTNLTGDLTSSLGNSGTASDLLTVTETPAPLASQVIAPSTVVQGGEAQVTFSIDNTAGLIPATGMSFNNALPNGIIVAPTPGVINGCGGTFSAVAGATSIGLTSGTVAAGASCDISVTLRSVTAGLKTNAPGVLVTDFTNNGSFLTASLTVTAAPAPTLSTWFSPSSIPQGGTSTLTINISNAGSLHDLTNMTIYNNDLPPGATHTTPSNQSTTCGAATLGSTLGGDIARLSITGGTLAAGASCQITAVVTTEALGPSIFTTGTLSSSAPTTTTASASFEVTLAPLPVFTQAFSPATIAEGATSTLTFTIDNTGSLIDATSLVFSNTFPTGLTLAASPNVVTTCTGGAITGNSSSVGYSFGNVAAGASCTFSADVTSVADATYTNLSGDLNSNRGSSGTSTADLIVTPSPTPVFTMALAPTTVIQGAETRVTLNIDNSGSLLAATSLASSLTLPAGVSVASNPVPTGDCVGGTLVPITGGASFSGGSVPAGSSCSVAFNVITAESGTRTFTTADLTSSLGNSGTATADLTITAAPIPTFVKAFDVASMEQGDVATLTFTIGNTGALVPATAGSFTDTFPANMTVAAVPNAAASCTSSQSSVGTFSPVGGAGSVSVATNTVAAGETCTYSVDITVVDDGSVTNTSSGYASSLGTTAPAVASINITPADIPAFSKAFSPSTVEQGGVSTLTLTMSNPTALVSATSGAFTDSFPASMRVAPTPNLNASCTTGASSFGTTSAVAGATNVSASQITINPGDTCTFVVDVVTENTGAAVNTSGNFTSFLGDSGVATATLSVTAAAAPTLVKSLAPTSIAQGGVSTLSFTADNSTALVSATAGAFGDTFPTGLVIAATPNLTSSCTTAGSVTGTTTGAAGAGTYAVSGMTLEAGASCTYTVDVTAAADGAFSIPATSFATSLGGVGATAATLTVTAAPEPGFSKAFGVASIVQGDVTSLTFTIDNAASLVDATAVGFGDTFPTGMTIATPSNAATTCTGGTITATAGEGSMSYSGGTVSSATSCTVSLDVTSRTVGSANNVSDALATSLSSTPQVATATLGVTAAPILGFTKNYTPDTIEQGTNTTAVYVIDNSAALIDATSVAFSDTLPTGAVIATPNGVTNTCGGTLAAPQGGASITLTGAGILAGATCQIEVDVTASDVGNTSLSTSDLTSADFASTDGVAASLTVTAAALPGFAKVFAPDTIVQGGISTLTFTINNATAFVSATALDFTDTMPTGMVVADTPNAATTCSAGTLTATAGSGVVSYTGGTLNMAATCTVSVDVTAEDVATLNNVSGALTSSLGDSGTASDTLSVTSAPLMVFTKAFGATSIVQGGVVTLTHTIDNSAALIDAESLAFAEALPAGATIATPSNAATTCSSATLAAVSGDDTYQLSGGEIDPGATCTVSVDITATTVGNVTTLGGDLTSTRVAVTPVQATFAVTAATAPSFAKAFSPASIGQNGVSTLTLTMDNTSALLDATSAAFSDGFPTGMTIATVPNLSTTCTGGTLAGASGATAVSYSGGTIPAGASCAVQVDVTTNTTGAANNVSGDLTTSLGNSGNALATLTVQVAGAPEFTNEYVPAQIVEGGSTTLRFTIDNSGNFVPVGGVGFNTNLPTGLSVAGATGFGTTGMSTTCGGTVTAPIGATSVSLTGGSVAAASSCTVSVPVTSTAVGTLGAVTGSLTSDFGGATISAAAGAGPLVVVTDPEGRVTFVQQSPSDATFSFASSEAALNFAISTTGGTGSSGAISVTAGTYVITQTRPSGFGNTSLSCSDADSTVDVLGGVVTLRLASAENVTCTFNSGDSATLATETINSFLTRRNNLLLSNGPTRGRRLSRLSQGIGTSQTLSFQKGDLKSISPVNFNLLSLGSGSYSLSTSLSQVERAGTMFALAHDGDDDFTQTLKNRRYDVWFEAHYSKFKGSGGADGHFGVAYFGVDYLVNNDVLAGFMLQFDSLEDVSAANNTSVDGSGWMAGPYVTARLAPNLILDGRFAIGQSNNDITTALSSGNFDTNRWLLDVNLSGDFDYKNWVISPNLNISYIEDRQHAFTDSLNAVVPEQTVSLGQIKIGPTFSTSYVTTNKVTVQPSFTLNGIYNFGNRKGPVIANDTADESNGFRGRVEAAVKLTNRQGTQLDFGANYDGIGKSDFESWGLKLGLRIPLQ